MDLAQLPKKNIRAVFTDLDGTLTDEGQMRPATFDALAQLRDRGFWTVIVSGRPAGWADCLMRLWPIDAMIFENGAGIVLREGQNTRTEILARDKNFVEQRAILQQHFDKLRAEIPDLKLATDQRYRLLDFAVDYAEEPPFLSQKQVEKILEELGRDKRVTAKLSSIHINYWYGAHTKVTACRFLLEHHGAPRGIGAKEVVFCGDSPNDEPLFQFFPHSIGVANIHKFLDRLTYRPKYMTKKPSGSGFREVVAHLLTP